MRCPRSVTVFVFPHCLRSRSARWRWEYTMSVSRPSRVGDPSPNDSYSFFRSLWEDYDETGKVDRRLEQLQRARERKEELRPQREREKFEKKWDGLRRQFNFSPRQESLLRAVDGHAPTVQDAIKQVYGAEWERLTKRNRRRHLGKLRTLQHAINTKYGTQDFTQRVEIFKGRIHLVSSKEWKKPRADRFPGKSKTQSPKKRDKRRKTVPRCVEFLRTFLTEKYKTSLHDGWYPVAMLNDAAQRKGFQLRTIRTARKHLHLELKKAKGYGGKGGWMVRLPVEKG